MTEPRWVAVPKGAYRGYLRKAEAVCRAMGSSIGQRNFTGAGLEAIHCTISCCDALTAFYLGRRSRGQDHLEALHLLDQAGLPGWDGKVGQVSEVLGMRNLIEYEAREPREEDVRRVVLQASRILAWARGALRDA